MEADNLLKIFLNNALRDIMDLLKAECGSLFLFDPKNNDLVLDSFFNSKDLQIKGLRKRIGEGISGKVVELKTPVLVNDINGDMRFTRNGFSHYNTSSFISIPLFGSSGLLGLMNIADKKSREPFSQKDMETAVLLTRYSCISAGHLLESPNLVNDEIKITRERFHGIVGKSAAMQKIYTLIEAITNTRATVIIHGESGTGKRLIAYAIHNCSELERGKPFIEVSCGALTETLLESELFGHVKGAFTGAIKDKPGRFELAHGGTIFLDEIDAFSPTLQVKLLRVLQEGEFERVGDSKTVKVDIRVIAATNQKLEDLIKQGKFRKDLYYRLNIIAIELPPLRNRKMDIPLLVEDFIKKHKKHINKKIEGVSDETISLLNNYDWPGNIRELENVIERATILSKGPVITPGDLPDFLNNPIEIQNPSAAVESLKLRNALKHPEKDLILKALETANGSRNEASKILGINRTTLYKKMQAFGLLNK